MKLKRLKYYVVAALLLVGGATAQIGQKHPTNVRYIGGNYNDARPYFSTLNAALNDVKPYATISNPYTFYIASDTIYIADWDSVYNNGTNMQDSISTYYNNKIKWAGFGVDVTVNFILDTIKVSAGTTVNDILLWDGTKYVQTTYQDVDSLLNAFKRVVSTADIGVVLNDASASSTNVTSINNAITTLNSAGGGTLIFFGGRKDTIQINNPINLESNINLVGDVGIFLTDNSDTTLLRFKGVKNNVNIIGLTFDGNMHNQTMTNATRMSFLGFDMGAGVSDISIKGITIRNIGFAGIRIASTVTTNRNIKIDKSTFLNMGGAAIAMAMMDDISVTNNYFNSWNEYGLDTSDTQDIWLLRYPMVSIDGYPVSNFKFENNTSISNDSTNLGGSAFGIEAAAIVDNAKINDNIFWGHHTGISGYWRQSIFTGNTFKGGTGLHNSGFEIAGDDNLIADNNIHNGAIYVGAHPTTYRPIGQYGNNNSIIGNKIRLDTNYIALVAISLGASDADTAMFNNVIQNNQINLTGTGASSIGISVGQANLGYMRDLFVDGNIIVTDTLGGAILIGTGINISTRVNSNNIFIEKNIITGLDKGIFIRDTTGITDLYITNNKVKGNTSPIVNVNTSGGVIIKGNVGYLTVNTDTVVTTNDNSITDSVITVTHGLAITPDIKNISVTLISDLGSASYYYILASDVTSTIFKIRLNADPGKVVRFNWQIVD